MIVELKGAAVIGEVEIAAPPESVFDAFTDPQQLAEWWGSPDTYTTDNWRVDLRAGGAWSCEARGKDGNIGTVHGVYVEVDRPRALVYTWNPSWDQAAETRVDLRFEPIPSGTRVHLTHSGFEGREDSQKGHSQGWLRVAGYLAAYFQTKGA